jgi:hypothetical protein
MPFSSSGRKERISRSPDQKSGRTNNATYHWQLDEFPLRLWEMSLDTVVQKYIHSSLLCGHKNKILTSSNWDIKFPNDKYLGCLRSFLPGPRWHVKTFPLLLLFLLVFYFVYCQLSERSTIWYIKICENLCTLCPLYRPDRGQRVHKFSQIFIYHMVLLSFLIGESLIGIFLYGYWMGGYCWYSLF